MSRPVSRRISRYLRRPVRVRDRGELVRRPLGGRARYRGRSSSPRRARRGASLEHDGLCLLELVVGSAIFVVLLAIAAAARLVW